MLEATLASVFDAAQVRLAQLGQSILDREEMGLDTEPEELAALDLRFGLETAAQLPEGRDRDAVVGYLIETYGLNAAFAADPFLRPLLPPIPTAGATVRFYVLGTGYPARVLGTGVPGRALSNRVALIAPPAPL